MESTLYLYVFSWTFPAWASVDQPSVPASFTFGETNKQKSIITNSGLPVSALVFQVLRFVFSSWLTRHTSKLMQLPYLFKSRISNVSVYFVSFFFILRRSFGLSFYSPVSILNFCFNMSKQQENNDAVPFIVLKIPNSTRVTGKFLIQRKCSYSLLCMALGNSRAPFSFISTEAEKKETTPFHDKVDIPKHILAISLKTCHWAAALSGFS